MSRQSPPKNGKAEHAACVLLSQEANTKIFSLLEPKTQALSTALVSVARSRLPKHPEWTPFRTGAVTLSKDHVRKAYFIQIYDIVDWEKVREEELVKGTSYQVSHPKFHQIETANGEAMGLKFSSEFEARKFAQIAREIIMTGHYKTDGCPMPVWIVDAKDNEEEQGSGVPFWGSKTKVDKTSTPRPPRPATVYRDAPLSQPPPPPPGSRIVRPTSSSAIESQTVHLSPPPQPPPPVNKTATLTPATTHANEDDASMLSDDGMTTGLLPTNTSHNATATLDRKRPKSKRITKAMIGNPTNFLHVYHVGYDPNSPLDEKAMQSTVGEAVKRAHPSRPPPPPPPPSSSGNHRNSAPLNSSQGFMPAPPSLIDGGQFINGEQPSVVNKIVTLHEQTRTNPENSTSLDANAETEEHDSISISKGPSGEFMEEILNLLSGMPFDAYTHIDNTSSDQENTDKVEHSSSLDPNGSSSVVFTANAELSEAKDNLIQEVNQEALQPAQVVSQLVSNSLEITESSNFSPDDKDLSQTDKLKIECVKLESLDDQSIDDPCPQADTSSDTECAPAGISPNTIDEVDEKLAETSSTPTEIQPIQKKNDSSTQEKTDDHGNVVATYESTNTNGNGANKRRSSEIPPEPNNASSHMTSETSPKPLPSNPSEAPSNAQTSEPSNDNSTESVDNKVPPQKPARRRLSNMSLSSSPPPPTNS